MTNKKSIIGLTGNIATGKSVVRRMLANSGALGIDGDDIAHRMLYPGGPAYQPVIEAFGEAILSENQQISRRKLGEIVFNDPDMLEKLESLVHPAVTQSILQRAERSQQPVIVIEAIKLLEAGLGEICDTIWVSHASPDHQLERLMHTRQMDREEARNRIAGQPPQATKRSRADIVINTEGPFMATWHQVQQALNDTIKTNKISVPQNIKNAQGWESQTPKNLPVTDFEAFWKKNSSEDIPGLYESLGMRMVLPILFDSKLESLVIWKNSNFTAALSKEIQSQSFQDTDVPVLQAFEGHSERKQCEILFAPDRFRSDDQLISAGFERCLVEDLDYPAWRMAGERFVNSTDEETWVKIIAQPIETSQKFI